jgi:Flp pilus assembly protein TadD
MALLQRLVDDVEIVSTLAERKAVAASERSTSTKAWLERALAHQAAGSVDEARAAFVQAQQFATTETSWLVRVNVARARFELAQGRQFDAAASAIAAAVATSPDDADVRAVVVDVALARGERELACIERLAARARFRDDARFAATKECP